MIGDLRLVDLVDIVLVAGLVAAVLVWVRRIRAGRVAAGLLAVVVLYLAARSAGLSLLSGLFEGSFALFVVIVVVIFQRELRRLFDSISWPGLEKSARVTSEHGLDILVETLFDFARRGIGALVVIPAKEPVEPHVSGGVELNGKLSRPLLASLFDPNSPGHDGAAVLEGDQVSRFAVHLPLSTNTEELSDVGTRHAAALGLSEQCDAVCLAVSEERRVVSLARGGELTVVQGATELRALLAELYQTEREPSESGTQLSAMFRRHWVELALSLGLVAGLWMVLVAGTIEAERTYELRVRLMDAPADVEIGAVEPERVAVTFRGASSDLSRAKAGDFAIAVDVSLARIGQTSFSIRDEDVQRPPTLEVIRIEPRRIHLIVAESR